MTAPRVTGRDILAAFSARAAARASLPPPPGPTWKIGAEYRAEVEQVAAPPLHGVHVRIEPPDGRGLPRRFYIPTDLTLARGDLVLVKIHDDDATATITDVGDRRKAAKDLEDA